MFERSTETPAVPQGSTYDPATVAGRVQRGDVLPVEPNPATPSGTTVHLWNGITVHWRGQTDQGDKTVVLGPHVGFDTYGASSWNSQTHTLTVLPQREDGSACVADPMTLAAGTLVTRT